MAKSITKDFLIPALKWATPRAKDVTVKAVKWTAPKVKAVAKAGAAKARTIVKERKEKKERQKQAEEWQAEMMAKAKARKGNERITMTLFKE